MQLLLDGAFTVLLFLISGVSAGIVLPPTNVTVSCSNLNVTVSWAYRHQRPQTSFRVRIIGSEGKDESVTTDHQLDLSHFVWASESHFLDIHYVTVTAVEGGNRSEPVKSETLTFNRLKTAKIQCKLDFPPVDVTDTDSGATVSFMNPLRFYSQLKGLDTGTFKFSSSLNSRFDGACTAKDINCKHDVTFPEDVEKKCLSLTGCLGAKNDVGEVVFRETGRICASESSELHMVTLTIILFVLAIVISVIIIIICKVKAWTLKTPDPPEPLTSQLQSHREGLLKYAPVSPTDISPLTFATCEKPLVSSEEDDDDDDNLTGKLQGSGAPEDFQPPARSYAEGGLSDGYRRDDDSADDSEKTETVSMDSEEVEVSPYDCPHTLQVDMGDGDMATGYRD